MRCNLAIAAVTVAAFAATPLAAQQSPPQPQVPEISVSAQGEARTVPDRATVTLGVESRAATASEAARANASLQRTILDTLRALGFRNDQLTTANYYVRPDYQPDPQGRNPRIVGYVVGNTVQVTLQNPERAGQVIDAALAKGANTVHGLYFYLADPAPARRAAITDAVARARVDAEALAQAAGGRLGAVLEVTTAPVADPRLMARQSFARGVAGGMVTPVEAGETTVTATVFMRWAFVPGR